MQQPGQSEPPPPTSGVPGGGFFLDPSVAAKQMAAMNSAGRARRATQVSSDVRPLSPTVPFATIGSYQPPTMQPQPPQPPLSHPNPNHARTRLNFYNNLAQIMLLQGNPLPPAITGVATNYDPASSHWRFLEPAAEQGGIRLGGKDVELFRLFQHVASHGGFHKVNTNNTWNQIAMGFNLPSEIPHPQGGMNAPTGIVLAGLYKQLLLQVEEGYFRNQRRTQGQMSQSNTPNMGNLGGAQRHASTVPLAHQQQHGMPLSRTTTESPQRQGSIPPVPTAQHSFSGLDEMEDSSLKRKREESSDFEFKRMRASTAETRQLRQKIEYVPIAREMDTYGGREVGAIEEELSKARKRRPVQPPDEWGSMDVEALLMSLKSRLPTEVSYAITTFTVLSTLRGTPPTAGFPLQAADDLLEEILDYIDELAFDGPEDVTDAVPAFQSNRELCEILAEDENRPFGNVTQVTRANRPLQPPSVYILSLLNLLRNFSLTADNQAYMGKFPRLVNILLQLCNYRCPNGSTVSPTSPALSLRDLLHVRREVLHILLNISSHIDLEAHDDLIVRQIFDLASSFLVDPQEAIGPVAQALHAGVPQIPPPLSADLALELFTKVAQPDNNRRKFSQVIPQDSQWQMLEALVHRMPISEMDFKLSHNDNWITHIEKLIFSIYCLGFIASPALKRRIKTTRSLGLAGIFLRFIRRITMAGTNEFRQFFQPCARRAIEMLKLIDEGGDSFDRPQISMPVVAFGMGYGEQGSGKVEIGMGMFSGYQEDVTWGILRSNSLDLNMFLEVESLARVGE